MIDRKTGPYWSDPDVVSGALVFLGTRVPAQNLIDHLYEGLSLEEFLDDFPSVSRDQAILALTLLREQIDAMLHAPVAR